MLAVQPSVDSCAASHFHASAWPALGVRSLRVADGSLPLAGDPLARIDAHALVPDVAPHGDASLAVARSVAHDDGHPFHGVADSEAPHDAGTRDVPVAGDGASLHDPQCRLAESSCAEVADGDASDKTNMD